MSEFNWQRYDRAVAKASAPLVPIRQALADKGINMEVTNTGGLCMVGYVFLSDDGFAGPHLGVSVEGDDEHLVCAYRGSDDEPGVPLSRRYLPLDQAVETVASFVKAPVLGPVAPPLGL